MVGRPRKYHNAQDAAAAKLASNLLALAPILQLEEREVEEVVQNLNIQDEQDEDKVEEQPTTSATPKTITNNTAKTITLPYKEKDTIRQASVQDKEEVLWDVGGNEESEV
ncbi:hypothetical protein V501_02807 [Pseudogymnoascus sp. VKM F-4519 (FW-2642)]|nr:hypothetical protein V501_02807 [Pseudogymnoascus sp. VKM F-4519 (FW-2642)]